ncbi:MAG: hypothetical protein KIT22_11760 [Verrucomicrobiae bacterium]|nr:hypothetical protein [Verrucomicrobiae bacterium]
MNKIRRDVAAAILNKARKHYLMDDSRTPLATTYSAMEEEMAQWFRAMPRLNEVSDQALLVTGRLFWHLGNEGGRWSDHFLRREKLPAEISSQLAALDSLCPPELNVSVMIPREPPVAREDQVDKVHPPLWNRILVALTMLILTAAILWHLL